MTDHPADEHVLTPDATSFRHVLGHFATGVTVITALDGDDPVGLAANSFTAVSLDPPLVLFCPAKTSSTWPRIQRAGRFAVNILGHHQEEVSRLFSSKEPDRFSKVEWHRSPQGSPLLSDAVGFVDCTIEDEHDAGDHVIVVGRVHALGISQDAGPLLFFRGQYGRLLDD